MRQSISKAFLCSGRALTLCVHARTGGAPFGTNVGPQRLTMTPAAHVTRSAWACAKAESMASGYSASERPWRLGGWTLALDHILGRDRAHSDPHQVVSPNRALAWLRARPAQPAERLLCSDFFLVTCASSPYRAPVTGRQIERARRKPSCTKGSETAENCSAATVKRQVVQQHVCEQELKEGPVHSCASQVRAKDMLVNSLEWVTPEDARCTRVQAMVGCPPAP